MQRQLPQKKSSTLAKEISLTEKVDSLIDKAINEEDLEKVAEILNKAVMLNNSIDQ